MTGFTDIIAKRLSPKRYQHSLGVADCAAWLAERYGVDTQKARVAGILHDYARELPGEQLLSIARKIGIEDEIFRRQIELLHAPVGAHLIEADLGIADREILLAVAYHTTGRRKMGELEQIIYLADMIEPGRSYPGVEKVRELAAKGLRGGILGALDHTLKHLLEQGKTIHPDTVNARNDLILGGNSF